MTRFWLIRHALVEENARMVLYGTMDVPLCESTLLAEEPTYQALARRLPRPAVWKVTPLSRTRRTAETIFASGYPETQLGTEPGMLEQTLGEWEGLVHAALPPRLSLPAHAFWPLSGEERPPGGESMRDVIERVGEAMEAMAERYPGEDVVVVSHGGAIRGAVAHALQIEANNALHLAVQNLSLTRLERHPEAWRVVCVNEMLGY